MIRLTSRFRFPPRQRTQSPGAQGVAEPEQNLRTKKKKKGKRPGLQVLNRRKVNSVRPRLTGRPGEPGQPGRAIPPRRPGRPGQLGEPDQPRRMSRRDQPNKLTHAGQPSRTNRSNPQSRSSLKEKYSLICKIRSSRYCRSRRLTLRPVTTPLAPPAIRSPHQPNRISHPKLLKQINHPNRPNHLG